MFGDVENFSKSREKRRGVRQSYDISKVFKDLDEVENRAKNWKKSLGFSENGYGNICYQMIKRKQRSKVDIFDELRWKKGIYEDKVTKNFYKYSNPCIKNRSDKASKG